jgi:hypothetical protein
MAWLETTPRLNKIHHEGTLPATATLSFDYSGEPPIHPMASIMGLDHVIAAMGLCGLSSKTKVTISTPPSLRCDREPQPRHRDLLDMGTVEYDPVETCRASCFLAYPDPFMKGPYSCPRACAPWVYFLWLVAEIQEYLYPFTPTHSSILSSSPFAHSPVSKSLSFTLSYVLKPAALRIHILSKI